MFSDLARHVGVILDHVVGVLLVSTVLGFESQLLLVGVEGDEFDNVDVFRCV